MEQFLKRISSRKFLLAFFVQVAVVASMIFRPESKVAWVECATQLAELGAMAFAAAGYANAEGKVDAARAANGGKPPDLSTR